MSEVTSFQRNETILDRPAEFWRDYFKDLAFTETGERGKRARYIWGWMEDKILAGDKLREDFWKRQQEVEARIEKDREACITG